MATGQTGTASSYGAIALIEHAIVHRLRTVQRAYTGLVVESYGGQLDDELFGWVRTLPATWVTFDGLQSYKRMGRNTFKAAGTFEVLCAQRALVENAGRLNDAATGADVGVYQLLEDNKRALANQVLGLAIQPVTPGAIRSVAKSMVNREAIVVYAQTFATEWMERFDEVPEASGELRLVGMEYYLKPQHAAPADPPDATDLITTRTTP